MLFGQCEVTKAHTKFGVNMSKLCRDTVSDAVWHHSSKFVDVLNENVLGYVCNPSSSRERDAASREALGNAFSVTGSEYK